jgi:superfamily II DNA or RNA helicase
MEIEFDYNKSTCKLQLKTDNTSFFNSLREHFSVENKGSKFAKRFRKFAAARKYVITPTGQCDFGLYWEIRQYLTENQIICNVKTSESFNRALSTIEYNSIYTDFTLELREYQHEVLKRALQLGRGTCELGTGAGKTLTTAALIENYYRNSSNLQTFKCLVIVPYLSLVEQTYNEFIDCGVTFTLSKWTGNNEINHSCNVIICNTSILQSRFEESEWVKYVDLLIVDECHMIKSGNGISKIVNKIKTTHKYGFTGTIPEEQIDKWCVIGKFGPVIYKKSSFDLREEDYLVNVEVKIINIKYNTQPPKLTTNRYRDELNFLINNEFRNEFITKLCGKITNNTLILVNQIAHGEEIYSHLVKNKDKQVFFIRGSVEVSDREKIKQLIENNSDIICVAISAIFSTGINIKNLHNIIFAEGGKSFIRTVQSIGRGLRKNHNKNKLTIFDFGDELHYSKAHLLRRQEIYNKEKIKFSSITIKQP